jgi:hypothetical protein
MKAAPIPEAILLALAPDPPPNLPPRSTVGRAYEFTLRAVVKGAPSNHRGSFPSVARMVSTLTGRTSPRSVMMAVMREAGVTSKAGL